MGEIKDGGIGRAGAEETGGARPAPDNTGEVAPEQAREGDTSAAKPVEKRGEMLAFAAAIEKGLIKGRFENEEQNRILARKLLEIRDALISADVTGFNESRNKLKRRLEKQGISYSDQQQYQLFHLVNESTLSENKWREKLFDLVLDEETDGEVISEFERFLRKLAGEKETEAARSSENNPRENSS